MRCILFSCDGRLEYFTSHVYEGIVFTTLFYIHLVDSHTHLFFYIHLLDSQTVISSLNVFCTYFVLFKSL